MSKSLPKPNASTGILSSTFTSGNKFPLFFTTVTAAAIRRRFKSCASWVFICWPMVLMLMGFWPFSTIPRAYLYLNIFLQCCSMSFHEITPCSIASLTANMLVSMSLGISNMSFPAFRALTHGSPSIDLAPCMSNASVKISPSNPISSLSKPLIHCSDKEQGVTPSSKNCTSMCAVSMPPRPAPMYLSKGNRSYIFISCIDLSIKGNSL